MNQSGFRILSIVVVLIPTVNELLRTFVRPLYGKREYGIWSSILGWLPNYLAALGTILLGILFVLLILLTAKKAISFPLFSAVVGVISILTFSGLILHEVTQKNSGLYYDIEDVYATIGGVLTGCLIFLNLYKGFAVFLKENQSGTKNEFNNVSG